MDSDVPLAAEEPEMVVLVVVSVIVSAVALVSAAVTVVTAVVEAPVTVVMVEDEGLKTDVLCSSAA